MGEATFDGNGVTGMTQKCPIRRVTDYKTELGSISAKQAQQIGVAQSTEPIRTRRRLEFCCRMSARRRVGRGRRRGRASLAGARKGVRNTALSAVTRSHRPTPGLIEIGCRRNYATYPKSRRAVLALPEGRARPEMPSAACQARLTVTERGEIEDTRRIHH